MERQIKFRAWEKETEQMLHFNLLLNSFDRLIQKNNCPIMQFTGLLDKNGKEIYEGDWCSAMFRDKNGIQVIQGQIIMSEYMWCIDCTGCVGDDLFSINRPHSFEVIGNIYETPELLTKE